MKRVIPVLLVVLGASAALAESKLAKAEKQALPKVAAEWVELGKWCLAKHLEAPAKMCADRAKTADAEAPGVADLVAAASSMSGAPDEKAAKEWPKKLQAAGKKIAAEYDKLLAAGAGETDREVLDRLDAYAFAAVEVSPEPARWEKLAALAEQLEDGKDRARAGRLIERALAMKPPEKAAARFQALSDAGAIKGVVLKQASAHSMRYFLSLPPEYARSKGKKWPVLMCVDGSSSLFEEYANGWRDNRGKLGFIIVSLCTFSNADRIDPKKYGQWYPPEAMEEGSKNRLGFDEAGILAVIDDLKAKYDAEERVYFTGFSAGGRATYMMIWKHPDRLACCVPVCAITEREPTTASADQKNFPIHIITGGKDPRFEPGADEIAKALGEAGFPNVKRTTIPELGHNPAMVQVVQTFKPYMEGSKKRGDKQ